jgi:hypothetical protein
MYPVNLLFLLLAKFNIKPVYLLVTLSQPFFQPPFYGDFLPPYYSRTLPLSVHPSYGK